MALVTGRSPEQGGRQLCGKGSAGRLRLDQQQRAAGQQLLVPAADGLQSREPIGSGMSRTAFVTVGTTKFDALIAAVDTAAAAEALSSRGYDRLVMQVCASTFEGQGSGLLDFRGLEL